MNLPLRLSALCLIIGSLFFLASHPLKENNYSPASDEGYYYHYAKTVSEEGVSALPPLIKWYGADKEARKYPTPARVGYIFITALWLKIFGASFSALGLFSFFCFLLFLATTYYFCQKYFGLDIALLLTVLLSSSPLILSMSRRALCDSAVNFLSSVTLWIFLDFLLSRKRITYVIFLILLTLSILVKESSIALIIFLLIFCLWHNHTQQNKVSFKYIAAILWVPLSITSFILVMSLGGVENFALAVKSIASAHFEKPHPNPYVTLFCAGPWYRYIVDYLLLTPLTTLLFIGYTFYLLTMRRLDVKIVYFLLYFIVSLILFSGLEKNVRYAITFETVFGLFSVLAIYEIFRTQISPQKERYTLYAITFIFFINIQSFFHIFYTTNLLDPISYHLLRINGFIPTY